MGKLLIAQAARSAIFEISGVLDREETLAQIRDQLKRNQSDNATVSASPQEAFAQADLVVDFSIAEAVALNAKTAAEQDSAYLVGVTGLDETATTALKTAAQKVAVLHASNVSTGVAVLALLVRQAATLLDESWDVEVLEMHHRYKSDAPSGTALRLGEQVAKGRGLPADAVAQSAKKPITGGHPQTRQYRLCGLARGDSGGRPRSDFCRRRRTLDALP